MNRALLLLMALQCRGWARSMGRSVRTVKGALLVLVGLLIFVPWVLSLLFAPRAQQGIAPDDLRHYGPAAFLAYCIITVVFSRGERALYFNPAEVNFLFSGPFTRRQLLAHKILSSILVALPTMLLLTVLFRIHARWFLAAFVGLLLAYLFLQLFTMAINLVAIAVGGQAYTLGRKLVLLALAAVLAVVLFQAGKMAGPGGIRGLVERVADSPAWQTLATPLGWFIEVFLVGPGDWLSLAEYGGLALGVVTGLLLVVFLLDAHYLESAASSSERIYSQIQRMRRGEGGGWRWRSEAGKARLRLRSFPWWGGAGPVAWRQTMTALRSLGRLTLLALVLLPILAGSVLARENARGPDGEMAGGILLGMLLWITLLMTPLVPFDFRGDLERMEVLKTLPLAPWRLAVGQLVAPVVLISLVQCLVLAGMLLLGRGDNALALVAMVFTLPFNFLLFGLDNLLFLCFPSRVMATHPGDFQALGRNVLFLLARIMVLLVAGLLAWLMGGLTSLLTGSHMLASYAVGWLTLAAFAAGFIPLLAFAFDRFDVSRDMPA